MGATFLNSLGISFSQEYTIIDFDMVIRDTWGDVTRWIFCFSFIWFQIKGSVNQKVVILAFSWRFIKLFKLSVLFVLLNSLQTLKDNISVPLWSKFNFSKPFSSFFTIEGGQQKLYLNLPAHETCFDHFLYVLQ